MNVTSTNDKVTFDTSQLQALSNVSVSEEYETASGSNNLSSAQTVEAAKDSSGIAQYLNQANAQEESSAFEEESLEDTAQMATELVSQLTSKDIALSFSVDKDINKTLISVTDRATESIIRQIPSEEFVKVVKSMQKLREEAPVAVEINSAAAERPELKGLLFDNDA